MESLYGDKAKLFILIQQIYIENKIWSKLSEEIKVNEKEFLLHDGIPYVGEIQPWFQWIHYNMKKTKLIRVQTVYEAQRRERKIMKMKQLYMNLLKLYILYK